MVEAARIAYRDFPTVVNEVKESSLSYSNTMSDYARMDSGMQSAQKAIGGSSDVAQLSQSYYWDNIARGIDNEETKQYYENTIILAVLAQIAIDGCKKVFEIDVNDDIARIRSQPCMKRERDYPEFMKWTHEISVTKNGKGRPQEDINKEKKRLNNRIDTSIICPMNQLEKCLDKIQGASRSKFLETKEYFIEKRGAASHRQIGKIRKMAESYDIYVRKMMILMNEDTMEDILDLLNMRTQDIIDTIKGMKISGYTMNKLIGSVLTTDENIPEKFKYSVSSRLLNILYKSNKSKFLSNFTKECLSSGIIKRK